MTIPPEHRSRPDREAEALAEMAATRVAAPTASVLVAAFLFALLAGPLAELLEPAPARPAARPAALPRRAAKAAAEPAPLRVRLADLTTAVDRNGALARRLRPAIQAPLLGRPRYGNGQVIAGRDGWLFLQESFAHTVGPGFLAPGAPPDPRRGLIALDRELRVRGIRLVFFPVPEKEQVYPRHLRAGAWTAPPTNPSLGELVRRLRRAGVLVFDPSEALFLAARTDDDLYLDSDTHWTPRGMDLAASGLAELLRRRLGPPAGPPAGLRRRAVEVARPADLGGLLGLGPARRRLFPSRTAAAFAVFGADGARFSAARTTAPVVVLGDSFSLVYGTDPASGGSGGFAEQLAFHLDRPVALRAEVTRNNLTNRTDWLSREPELLAQARVVVYEVAARKLSQVAIWKPTRIRTPRTPRTPPPPPRSPQR